MQNELRSCQKTSNWQDASEVRETSGSHPPFSQHPGPFQGQPIPPRGNSLKKL